MTTGVHAVNLANKWLNVLRGTTFTGLTAVYVKLHTGDPGAAATSNASAVTTRALVTWSAAASGALVMSNTPSWAMTATETISHISTWDASTGGNFLFSGVLGTPKPVINGDSLNLATLGVSAGPLAA